MVYRHSQCANTCQYVEACRIRDTANAVLVQSQQLLGGIGKMSQALWCDAGDHPFSEKDPGKRHFTETKYNSDQNSNVTETIDWCGACAAKITSGRKSLPVDVSEG